VRRWTAVADRRGEGGFTLVELLVGLSLLAMVSVGMYSILFSSSRAADTTVNVADASAEARRGFNRLVRDTREAQAFQSPSTSGYTVEIDFDGDGVIEPVPSDPTGNYERLTFRFNQLTGGFGTITVSDGTSTEVLVDEVDCIRRADGTCYAMFTFSSSRLLDYDTNQDGVTSAAELDVAPTIGNSNNVLDGDEVGFIDRVSYALRIRVEDGFTNFYAEAQLRNRR
jgi:prepilin-type N-terminal cleavage/methylation domain-containing protein